MNNGEFQAHTERIDQLVQRVTETLDGEARDTALELLQAVMDLHGSVVSRIVELLQASESGRASLAKLGSDPMVCGLLVLYGVHPVSIEERVARAVEQVRPKLKKQSGNVELLRVSEGVVRVRIEASGHGCGNSPDSLKQTVEQAILEAAPEVVEIVAEGMTAAASGFVSLDTLQPARKEESRYEESAA
ncbi:MAG TPA: NifU family protein [Terriglobales bacterium]|nr:NifU family protein [Terriglobales bacterium]